MTMDKSLRRRTALIRNRGVLTRDERIARLQETERWTDATSPLGLPKVRVYKLSMKKKKKRKEDEEGADAAATPAKGAAAKGAAAKAPAAKAPAAKAPAGKK